MSSTCPSCGTANREAASFCAACGAGLPWAQSCGTCGASNPANQRFCGSCGTALGGGLSTTPREPTSVAAGRYEILRSLGEGSRKRVYLAADRRLDRQVAIAMLKVDDLDGAQLEAVRRGIEATGRLGEHPNLVTVFDVGAEGGVPYVVSRLMRYPSLDEVLGSERPPLSRVLAIADDLCAGLAHAHAHGIIHRALKPRRIWVSGEGAAIGDFGASARGVRPRFTMEGRLVGAVHYMAPEQALGREVTATADLYALGAILYEMVCGRPPFQGEHPVAVVSQHLHVTPPSPGQHRELPERLEALILDLLAKEPDERPPGADAVRERMRAVGEELAGGSAEAVIPEVPADPVERLEEVFVGREAESAVLRDVFSAALEGRGGAALVSGESGVGKSRLLGELTDYARERGAEVVYARSHEGDGAPAYWPWVQVLRCYAEARDPAQLADEMAVGGAEIGRVVREVRMLLPGLPRPPELDAEQARLRFFEAVSTFLTAATGAVPGVILIEDLHWADADSIALLGDVVRAAAARSRLVVAASYQDSDLPDDHPLRVLAEELQAEGVAQHVRLEGLSHDDVGALLEAASGAQLDEAGAALAAVLHRESEGNPFFIREMLRELVDKGAIYQRGKRWVSDVTSVDELGIAEGVREVVSARLARLSDGCNQVLLTASIIGRHFDAAVLRRIGGFDDSQTRGMLEEAERAGVLARVGADGLYVFSHNLIRQTLYGRLANTRRVRLHRSTAEVLERLYGEDPEHLSALAYHYRQAALDGDSSKAIDYAIRAGAHATEHLAHDQAVEQLRYALDELRRSGRGDERATVELLCDLGDAEWNAGEFERSRGAFAEAAEVARRTGAVDALARAALGFGGGLAFRAGEGDEELIALLEQALQSVGSEGPMRARVMSRLAEALTFTGPRERVEELGRAALDAARTAGEPAALAAVLSNAHWALWAPDNLEERLYMAREIVRAAEKAGDAALAMDGHLWSVSDLLELGDVASADREAQVWLDLASDLRRPYHLWLVAVYKAMRALMEGALEQGERLAQQAFELGQRGGNQNAFQLFGVQVAALRREQNRYPELEDGLKLFVEQYPAIPTWRCALALMYSEAGRTEEAREQFEVLTVNRFGDLPRDMFWMTAMVQLSQCCAFLEDAERASQLRALLLPHKGRNVTLAVVSSSWGSSDRSLGLLAATMQRWDEAATHFERALAMNEGMGARTWLAQTQQEYAAMLGMRRARADAKRSEELLAAALATARELGLQRLEQRIASTHEQWQRPGPVALA